MSIRVFLSAVSDEFQPYRTQLCSDLTRHNVEVKVQEDFKDQGGSTLDKLDTYIAHCDAVVHLVGNMCGSIAGAREQTALLRKHAPIVQDLPSFGDALRANERISYTQWEAWLALYHGKLLFTAKARPRAPRAQGYAPTRGSRAAQAAHLARLEAVRRYPGCSFSSESELAKHIAFTAILDLLVKDYAAKTAQAREVAEGFIREMAGKVAAAPNLDFEGMKQAVRTAIEIYEKEIAGGQTQTNLDAIVGAALANAKRLTDEGRSKLAQTSLVRAAEALKNDEEDRRAEYTASVQVLYGRVRDIALAVFDGEAAAQAVLAMASALSLGDAAKSREVVTSEAKAAFETGRDKGSNVHLMAVIALRRRLLCETKGREARGECLDNLGIALWTLGARESGTARLEEAVTTYREALKERMQDRIPMAWAMTQNNLGNALATLGARENGTARLKEAVAAYRDALKERTRKSTPLEWATTQNNLGAALRMLGARESGTARLKQAVAAYRNALKERTRARVALQWATTQNNLANALSTLGEREGGTTRLEEAVAAYREALRERTQDRVPLDWATTQSNLGNALGTLGARENSKARLEEAVSACRDALKERTQDRVPLDWATTQHNLGNALSALGARESGTARLHEAVAAYRAALNERTQDRIPLDWAMTQNDLGTTLYMLGERENGTARLEEAVVAYREALKEWTRGRVLLLQSKTQNNLDRALKLIARRQGE